MALDHQLSTYKVNETGIQPEFSTGKETKGIKRKSKKTIIVCDNDVLITKEKCN